MIDVLLSLAATGEGTDALPQAAECADRPGLPQTQTGPVFVPYLKLFSFLSFTSNSYLFLDKFASF